MIGASEWVMFYDRYSIAEYERLAERFNPVQFDANALARTAAAAGQKYFTITSRHHDGFSMYDTAVSHYKITNSGFARDPIAELAEAFRDHGVRFGVYVSFLDLHHPAYRGTFRCKNGLAWDEYVDFFHGQISRRSEFVTADIAFHMTFVERVGHDRLLRVWQSFAEAYQVILEITDTGSPDLESVVDAHRLILAAIERRDPSEARRRTEQSLRRGQSQFGERLRGGGTSQQTSRPRARYDVPQEID